MCGQRASPAGLDHFIDRFLRAGKYCLDRTTPAVAHPACQAALQRVMLDEGAVADALHAAAHADVASDARLFVHSSSPASITRVPVQRETDQRSTDRI